MAAKSKSQAIVRGSSKTARQAQTAKITKNGGIEMSQNSAFIIPLAQGRRCYLLHSIKNKNLSLTVDSDDFITAITELAEAGFGERLLRELNTYAAQFPGFGWDTAAAILDTQKVTED